MLNSIQQKTHPSNIPIVPTSRFQPSFAADTFSSAAFHAKRAASLATCSFFFLRKDRYYHHSFHPLSNPCTRYHNRGLRHPQNLPSCIDYHSSSSFCPTFCPTESGGAKPFSSTRSKTVMACAFALSAMAR